MERYFVTEASSRPARCLHRGATVAACLEWVRQHWDRGRGRPAIWVDSPPAGDGPDGFVCLPAWYLDSWRHHAEKVVDDWERRWLLLASAPRAHRPEAREDLLDAVATALATASLSERARGELDVGF